MKGNRCAKEGKWGSRDQLTAQHLGPSRKQYHPEAGSLTSAPGQPSAPAVFGATRSPAKGSTKVKPPCSTTRPL